MAEPRLHQLERQFEPAVNAPVDAPRGVEVAQAVQALVFCTAVLVDDTGGDLRRMESALDDRVAVLDAAADVGEDQDKLALGEASRCSRKAAMTMGGSGTVRSPASDFGRPIAP